MLIFLLIECSVFRYILAFVATIYFYGICNANKASNCSELSRLEKSAEKFPVLPFTWLLLKQHHVVNLPYEHTVKVFIFHFLVQNKTPTHKVCADLVSIESVSH